MDVPVIARELSGPPGGERVIRALVHDRGGQVHPHHTRRRPSRRIGAGRGEPVLRGRRPKELVESRLRGLIDHEGVGDEVACQVVEQVEGSDLQQPVQARGDLVDTKPLPDGGTGNRGCDDRLDCELRGQRPVGWVGDGQLVGPAKLLNDTGVDEFRVEDALAGGGERGGSRGMNGEHRWGSFHRRAPAAKSKTATGALEAKRWARLGVSPVPGDLDSGDATTETDPVDPWGEDRERAGQGVGLYPACDVCDKAGRVQGDLPCR